ncbi:MAG: DUF2281 domain-containing protein [Spirochaetales bacterium]|nr:DUF2281 domain-containing protein [Spirochaetales bacterium]
MKTQITDLTLEDQISFMAYLANIIKQRTEKKHSENDVVNSNIKSDKPIRNLGKWRGQIWMADDFDETPDCFEEYM